MTTNSSPEQCPDEVPQQPSWWVCTVWIEAPNKPAEFIYGIAARCDRPARAGLAKILVKQPAWSLVQRDAIQSEEQVQDFVSGAARGALTFDPTQVGEARRVDIVDTRSFIADRLGHSAASVTSFASCTTPPSLGNDIGNWTILLKTLESEIGIAFASDDADHIGCFEVATLQPWLEAATPILVEAIRPDAETRQTAGVRQLHICRTREFAQAIHHAHVVCFSVERRIIDRLIVLEPGQQRSVPIEAPHAVDRFEMSIFNADGELLYRDGAPFIREVQFTMGLQGRKVQLDDDLARKANAQKKKDERPHGHVTSVTHERSRSTYAPVNENRERHRLRMTELRQRCFPAASHDKWFSRSLDDELGVIAHFDKLLNGGPISAAVLVDPFFSDDALVRLVLRLSSTDVKVTVVTSWTSSNPDTGRPLATSETPVTKLEALLRSTSPIVNPRLSVINLANGTAKAFHDRYLLLYPREGAPKAYLLSNSVNAMAANWPFCMSLLAEDVRPQAQAYIEGLCRGTDITGSTRPTITFQWPTNA